MNILTKLLELIVNFFGFVLAKIPHKCFLGVVDFIAWVMRSIDKRRFKDAMTNLNIVYGERINQKEKKAIIKRCYRNFSFILLEGIRVVYLSREKYKNKFEIIDEHYILDSLAKDGSAVFMGGHFGYWEAMATILPERYKQCDLASLGRLTNYKAINKLIISRREYWGVRLIDKKGAFKHLLKMYAKGNALAGILVDQHMSANEGIAVNFFGKEVTHTPIASILSRRFNVNIVPVFIDFNEDYSKFQIRFYPPIRSNNTEDYESDIYEATQSQAKLTEQVISSNPSSWFWFHKRWKAKYSHLY
ncbi:lipid A biosynthesis lauroyl acyltransferase [Helicobacter cappadocius]|uniref:Lipid A biosynthesis lauroyl acyltransferase n=1 Tax=Helicobacter cappadocius TaxID=3063998 RepID=A0AA90PRL5_9HELI|nr:MULTISPECIES: lipid A biosynthesis lauroyl acyltransferase [unclassified Helicobacter]MDO7252302.1 lipid A biosynthesis lauroyl acyltransferase [Helicobacter sp. faydin-H75]MDP2538169.1 lipid A biosynthesis lauroyl acyltransferase [Helicobacter sp. faydin-H76]